MTQRKTFAPPVQRIPNVRGLLSEESEYVMVDGIRENLNGWRAFKKAEMLEEGAMNRYMRDMRDREALSARVSSLERELRDYQHTMGLLLTERNEWIAKCDELKDAHSKAKEIWKRENLSFLNSVLDLKETQEKNLKTTLNIKEERIAELERALSLCDCRKKINLVEERANMVEQIHKEKDEELVEKDSHVDGKRAQTEIAEKSTKTRKRKLSVPTGGCKKMRKDDIPQPPISQNKRIALEENIYNFGNRAGGNVSVGDPLEKIKFGEVNSRRALGSITSSNTPIYDVEDELHSTLHGEDGGNDHDDHPNRVSIARKIWTFITS